MNAYDAQRAAVDKARRTIAQLEEMLLRGSDGLDGFDIKRLKKRLTKAREELREVLGEKKHDPRGARRR